MYSVKTITDLPLEIINHIAHHVAPTLKSPKKDIKRTFGNLLLAHSIFRASIREVEIANIQHRNCTWTKRTRKANRDPLSVRRITDKFERLPNGQKHGLYSRKINGRLQKLGIYHFGKREGKWATVSQFDTIHKTENFKDGRKHGLTTKNYIRDGGLHSTTYHENGLRHGKKSNYTRGGTLWLEQEFYHGMRIKRTKYYDNGAIKYVDHYYDGEHIGRTEYDFNGNLTV